MNLFNFIKANVPILDVIGQYTTLKKAGLYWKGHCPFHNEKTASFTVSPHKEIFYCFGCHEGGDVISFIAKTENLTPLEAAQHLVDRFSLNPPADLHLNHQENHSDERNKHYELCKLVASWCHEALLKSPSVMSYVQKRGFTKATMTYFSLGYFPGGLVAVKQLLTYVGTHSFLPQDVINAGILNEGKTVLYSSFEERIIFPIKDHLGRHCGFGGRIYKPTDERPKYYNSRENEFFEKGSILFGLDSAKKKIQETGYAFLVEGYTDCMAMVQHGHGNTVATLGTACTPEHLKQLARYAHVLYVVYDADKAGHQAMLRLAELCWQVSLELKVICLPTKEDPASYLTKENSLTPLITKAQDIFLFFIDALGNEFAAKPLSEKIALIRKLIGIINNIEDPLKRDILLQKASSILDVPLASMQQELERALSQRESKEKQEDKKPLEKPSLNAQTPQKLEKKIFCAILNNIQLFNNSNENYLIEYLPNPLRDILQKLKLIKNEKTGIDFIQFFDKLSDLEKQYVSSLLLEHEEDTQQDTFEQLLLQLHKKNWKITVRDIKGKLAQAKGEGDLEKMQKILHDFQELKQTVFKNLL